MLTFNFFYKYQHYLKPHYFTMASNTTSIHSRRGKYEEGISIRAQKRKRARTHYENRYKGDNFELDDELTNETTYYIENGLRKVYPYYFNFKTFVKGRWIGRTLLDVYTQEFKQAGDDHLEAIAAGSITVNGKPATPDTVLKDGMMLAHRCHRHEMPVLADPIEIIADTEDILVINKPSSIPVHPCGRYRYNSLTVLLRHQFGYKNLRTLYRLDRLTSGVLIMPKTTSVSKRMENQLQNRELEKEYVCRVVGKFPDGEVVCTEPLGVMSHKLSIYRVDPNGKDSKTTFTRLSYNGCSSVVKCVPHTGRTHQIRLHLQYLGHPIYNDPLYNSDAFGPSKGKGGVIENTLEQIEEIYMKANNVGHWKIGDNPKYIERFGNKPSETKKAEARCEAGASDTINEGSNATSNLIETGCENKNGENKKVGTESVQCDETVENIGNMSCPNDQTETLSSAELLEENDSGSGQPLKKFKLDNESETGAFLGAPECTNVEQTDHKTDVCSGTLDGEESETFTLTDSDNVESDNIKTRPSSKHVLIKDLAKSVTDPEFVESKLSLDEQCEDCRHVFQDPDRSELLLYLHAVTYRGPDWEYSSTLPYWAAEDFDEETDHTVSTS